MNKTSIEDYILIKENWPKEGVTFRDITPLLTDKKGFSLMVDEMYKLYSDKLPNIDYIAGCEARGFIIGSALAYKLGVGFVPLRKKGKLPGEVLTEDYNLEYGTASLEAQKDSISPCSNVLLVDDILATGGTMLAGIRLIERMKGYIVGCGFVANLSYLGGDKRIWNEGYNVRSILKYEK
jgi:adenine phosphoribosyltransferase